MRKVELHLRMRRLQAMPLIFIFALVTLSPLAHGQATANFVSTASDPTGWFIPNAKVTVANTDDGVISNTLSTSAGSLFTRLTAGGLTPGRKFLNYIVPLNLVDPTQQQVLSTALLIPGFPSLAERQNFIRPNLKAKVSTPGTWTSPSGPFAGAFLGLTGKYQWKSCDEATAKRMRISRS